MRNLEGKCFDKMEGKRKKKKEEREVGRSRHAGENARRRRRHGAERNCCNEKGEIRPLCVCLCAVGNTGAVLHTTSREEETVQYFVGRDILCQGLGVVGLGCACIAWSIAKIVLCTSCAPSVHWFATVWRRNWGGLHAGGTRQWWTAVILQMRSGKRYITLHYIIGKV